MTVIFHANCNAVPTLVGDVLISGLEPKGLKELVFPDHVGGITNFFPEGSGFVPRGMKRKLFLINRRMAIGISGTVIYMAKFVEDLQDRFAGQHKFTFSDIQSYLNDYDKDIIDNILAIILFRIGKTSQFAVVGDRSGDALVEREFSQFGRVLAVGSGNATVVSEIERMERYETHTIGHWIQDRIYLSLVLQLSLISQIHRIDNISGRSLLEYWGGAFEIIYLNEQGYYQFLENHTIVHWHMDLDDPGSGFSPLGVVKQEYRDGLLIIHLYEKGQFRAFGVRDVTGNPCVPNDMTMSIDDLDFNSDIISNSVLISKGGKVKTIYNFCDKHTDEYPGTVILEIDDDHRLRVNINSERQNDILEIILENEEKIRVRQEFGKKTRQVRVAPRPGPSS